MSTQRLDHAGAPTPPKDRRGIPIPSILMEDGALSAQSLVGALAEAGRAGCPVAHVIAAEGLVPPEALLRAQADHHGALILRRATTPPEETALKLLPAAFCLEHAALPWMHIGETLVIATARPEAFAATVAALPEGIGPVMMALTLEQDIHDIVAARHGAALARAAETARAAGESCRDLSRFGPRRLAVALALAGGFAATLWVAPHQFFAAALAVAVLSLLVSQGLKLAALAALPFTARGTEPALPDPLPQVSILVPLYDEEDIAGPLVDRLSRLTYPKAALEIVLILEDGDTRTEAALATARMPAWFRTVRVPPGAVTTKPRALNYALNFARGTIIGIYDAEDAPAPDQIESVVARFARAPPRTGCLQGILDFYNPRANWLSRCFTIEYASWFRVLLPGLARLGLVVPLGGTTVFLRRDALAATGGWDAHNVTEDADLGILLARRGYVTEFLPSVTREEANNRFWPWIKQRSRWLKGYAITWWVHTRRPRALVRDLGAARALGVQALFLVTVLQFLLAPILWSFWLIVFGLPHPLDGYLDPAMRGGLIVFFLAAEAVTLLVALVALARTPHTRLLLWTPTLFLYFPLGTIALYKGLWEVVRRPFYWDKTAHGRSSPDTPDADRPGAKTDQRDRNSPCDRASSLSRVTNATEM